MDQMMAQNNGKQSPDSRRAALAAQLEMLRTILRRLEDDDDQQPSVRPPRRDTNR